MDVALSHRRGQFRVLVAPDKFKSSLSAVQAAEAIATGVLLAHPQAAVVQLPVADGGEGTVAAAVAAGYRAHTVRAQGPTGRPVSATFAVRGTEAVVEMAEASGLRRLPAGRPAPLTASTYGTGQLILAALDAGARTIVLGLGGSATTDGGSGMACALGARLVNAAGAAVPPGGSGLAELAAIDIRGLDPRLADTAVVVASDVDNPLVGPSGAAAVYGPQKGAGPAAVAILDAALAHYAEVIRRDLRVDIATVAGAGAAGGTAGGAVAFLGARITSGIALVLQVIGFADALAGTDWVIIGEGSLDEQSLSGKAPVGVARAAAAAGIPVTALVGRLDVAADRLRAVGISHARQLLDLQPDPARARSDAACLLTRLAREVAGDAIAGPPATVAARGPG